MAETMFLNILLVWDRKGTTSSLKGVIGETTFPLKLNLNKQNKQKVLK